MIKVLTLVYQTLKLMKFFFWHVTTPSNHNTFQFYKATLDLSKRVLLLVKKEICKNH